MRASSDGGSVTVRALVRPRCVPTARRYGTRPVGIQWIFHTVFGTSHHCMEAFAPRRDHLRRRRRRSLPTSVTGSVPTPGSLRSAYGRRSTHTEVHHEKGQGSERQSTQANRRRENSQE